VGERGATEEEPQRRQGQPEGKSTGQKPVAGRARAKTQPVLRGLDKGEVGREGTKPLAEFWRNRWTQKLDAEKASPIWRPT
jgi:hypothetical protein